MKYVAIINTPGYLPDTEPEEFATETEAWAHLFEARMTDEAYADPDHSLSSETQRALVWRVANGGTGTITGPTPGYDGEHDLGVAYTVDVVS